MSKVIISRAHYDAVIFDLDGVITKTARVHARAWKELFDEYLESRSKDGQFEPFDIEQDYVKYVDGKPRYEGIESFLSSRNISLPFRDESDSQNQDTILALGNKKNQKFKKCLKEEGVDVYDSSLDLIARLRSRGFQTAVVSSSKNCLSVLNTANIVQLFDIRVDGVDAEHLQLKGKPYPDTFKESARCLHADPARCIVVEDAISGVQAGRRGGFGLVIGINRGNIEDRLLEAGADIVVKDLAELSLECDMRELPHGLISFEEIKREITDQRAAVFLDYDGTLTPIVLRPEDAVISQDMQETLTGLAKKSTVSIISGRGLADAKKLVNMEHIYFAGSHGFEIEGPNNLKMELEKVQDILPVIEDLAQDLQAKLDPIQGAQLERKKYSIAVHYRNVSEDKAGEVEEIVDQTLVNYPQLKKGLGKKVFELKPDIDWDKGKAIRWLMENLFLDQYGITPIFIGDDVTDEDGFKALSKKGITLIVGNEPRSTHAKYRLDDVETVRNFLMMLQAYLEDWKEWSLVFDGFNPELEGLREALCTLGNGYFATRGALPESKADGVHYPGTYLAGGYNRLKSQVQDRIVENEDLVNMPNWLCLTYRVPGEQWFKLEEAELIHYRQRLDIKNAVLYRTFCFKDKKGRKTKVTHHFIVGKYSVHLAALKTHITPLNWSGEMEICSALDGTVVNANVKRYLSLNNVHLEPVTTDLMDKNSIRLMVRTNQSNINVAQAARTEIFENRRPLSIDRELVQEPGYIAQHFKINLKPKTGICVEKIISMYTSKDYSISEPFLEAGNAVSEAPRFGGMLRKHNNAWNHIWRRFNVKLALNEESFSLPQEEGLEHARYIQRTLNLYCFHLLQSASLHSLDIDVGMPARGWHGEGYRGHIFWDEIIIFPYLNYRAPQITKTLLMYRYRRLDRAREMAKEHGYKGAMYPWQSGSNGREETQEVHLNPKSGRWLPDNSHLQRHINVSLVYNIWQYCEVSGDFEFLSFFGAEMILEIARFWSSITIYNPDLDRFEIHGVMGPDEYHDAYPDADKPGLNNNAYTNVMVVFVMLQALQLPQILPREEWIQLCEKLDIRKSELKRWEEITKKMRIVFQDDGIISQFEGYHQLLEFDWEGYKKKYGNIQRLDRILEAENDTPNRYKASKQADVLMLFYLFSAEQLEDIFTRLGYSFDQDTIPKNAEYYLKRTSNGSSLSFVVHSWIATRVNRTRSWDLFEEALKTDISDIQAGTTAEGIHLGAMSGCVDIIQRAYTGLEARGNILRFNPRFPAQIDQISFHLRYRGHWLDIYISPRHVEIEALSSGAEPIKVQVREEIHDLEQGKILKINL